MIPMTPYTFTPEKCWEMLALRDLLFRNSGVPILRFTNNEFADLCYLQLEDSESKSAN